MSEKKVYDKARIKLLDKNTGQVLKEVDPFTSAGAVDYKDDKTVYDELELLEDFKDEATINIQNLIEENNQQNQMITLLEMKNLEQDNSITNLDQRVTENTNNIENINTTIENHEEFINNSIEESVIYCSSSSSSDNRYELISKNEDFELKEGRGVRFKVPSDSTDSCYVNVDNTGYIKVKKSNKNDVKNFKQDSIVTIVFNGEYFFLQGDNGSGDALASDIIANKKATVDAGDIVGTMIDYGTKSTTLSCGQSIEYANGHYTKITVKAKDLASQTSGTATASCLLKGKTAWVNGVQITGNLDAKIGTPFFTDLFTSRHWSDSDIISSHYELYSYSPDDSSRHQTIYYSDTRGGSWEYEYLSDKYWSDKGIIKDKHTGKYYVAGYHTYGGGYSRIYEIDMTNHTTTQVYSKSSNNDLVDSYIVNNGHYVMSTHNRSSSSNIFIYVDSTTVYKNEDGEGSVSMFENGATNIVYGAGVNTLRRIDCSNNSVKLISTTYTPMYLHYNDDEGCLYMITSTGVLCKYDSNLNVVYEKSIGTSNNFAFSGEYIIFSGTGIIIVNRNNGSIVFSQDFAWYSSVMYTDDENKRPIIKITVSAGSAPYSKYHKYVNIMG
jgi:hypothetical protein